MAFTRKLTDFTTDRIHMRPLRPGDEEFLAQLNMSLPVMRYIHDGPLSPAAARSLAEAEVKLAAYRMHMGRWLIELPGSAANVGWIQLVKYRGPKFDSYLSDDVQIDYEMHPEFWGRGYMAEAARTLLSYAFATLQLPRVVVFTRPDNDRLHTPDSAARL